MNKRLADDSASSALKHLQAGSIERRSDRDSNALNKACLDDTSVPPLTWLDYVRAFMQICSLSDSFISLVRAITSLKKILLWLCPIRIVGYMPELSMRARPRLIFNRIMR